MRGSLNLEILSGGGLEQFWKSRWMGGGGGVKKPCLPSWGCGFFSGITQSDHACLDYLSHETYAKYSDGVKAF